MAVNVVEDITRTKEAETTLLVLSEPHTHNLYMYIQIVCPLIYIIAIQ